MAARAGGLPEELPRDPDSSGPIPLPTRQPAGGDNVGRQRGSRQVAPAACARDRLGSLLRPWFGARRSVGSVCFFYFILFVRKSRVMPPRVSVLSDAGVAQDLTLGDSYVPHA
ncbi:Uncharacterised protein [Bordetella pertussis]|nr:Uncharacterised protein [Bordetella pertussis]